MHDTLQEQTGNGARLQSPFPYFGGKSMVAGMVWQRFGNVPLYCEPFFGSGAVLLSRPHEPGMETVSDADGMICNFWRAVRADPDAVAYHSDYPAIEHDLHARHAWLVGQRESLSEALEGDPEYYDAKIAGWWCWGMSLWIGSQFCSGKGPWQHVDGKLIKGNAGQGIHKKRIHIGATGQGIHKLGMANGIQDWMRALSERLRRVRVCYGDWKRITGPTPTFKRGLTGVFLDPPYGDTAERESNLYTTDSASVAYECQEWCLKNGHNRLLRIALCGYVGEHEILATRGWDPYYWKGHGGYGNQGEGTGRANSEKEVIWFSPHCLKDVQMMLF